MKTILLFKVFIYRHLWKTTGLGIMILLGALLEGVNISLVYPIIEYIQNNSSDITVSKFKYIIALLENAGLQISTETLLASLFISLAFSFGIVFFTQLSTSKIFFGIAKDIRVDIFKKIIFAPMSYFFGISSGRLVSIIKDEAEYIGQSLNHITKLIVETIFIIIYSIIALYISWQLTLIVCVFAIIRYLLMNHFVKYARELGQKYTRMLADLNVYLINIYQGIDFIKTYVKENHEIKRLDEKTEKIKENYINITINSAAGRCLGEIVGAALICALIYMAFSFFEVNGSSLLLLIFIIFRIIPKVSAINDYRIRIADYSSKIVYLKEIQKQLFDDEQLNGKKEINNFNEEIVFNQVNFEYPGNNCFTLNDINLKIKKNKKIAIVGKSGSGKTTFVRLLLRLYSPKTGTITIDGVDIKDVKKDSWKNLVSVVSQDTFIFDDTIENNILYANEKATKKQFHDAIKKANALEFISKMPNQEKEIIGERGVKLSGGQRQRISIARAFLCNTPLLILDEATSSLDSETEKQIYESIERLQKEKTIIIVAHRFATIKNSDFIIVFDKGNIVEIGDHNQLKKNNGLYNLYYMEQLLN